MPRACWGSQYRSGRSQRSSSRFTLQFRRPKHPGVERLQLLHARGTAVSRSWCRRSPRGATSGGRQRNRDHFGGNRRGGVTHRECRYAFQIRSGRNSERARGRGERGSPGRCDRCQGRSQPGSRAARRRSLRQAERGNRAFAALLLRRDPSRTGRPRQRRRCPRRAPERCTDTWQAGRRHPPGGPTTRSPE